MDYDYIVVGAGSAGATLASRLSEHPDLCILLVEAGGRADHWSVRMPLGYYINYAGGPFNWSLHSTPQAELAGRRIYQPRGKGLGGSSAINGMAFLRGHPLDYDRWQAEGAEGWSHADVLPFFKRMEASPFGETTLRGGRGPLAVTRATFRSPVSDAFFEAEAASGFPLTDDFNGADQEGFGRFDQTIENGVRASTAHAYLRPARGRTNLRIATGCLVTGLIVANGRATGIRIADSQDAAEIRCTREVILRAGAFGSPQILMLSAIGPADHLRESGIDVVHDLPGVGGNLQDHLEVHISWEGPIAESLNRYATPWRRTLAGLQWLVSRSGVCAFNGALAGAFTASGPGCAHPDIQYHFFPFYLEGLDLPADRGGFCLCVGTLRASSRGTVRLASTDPPCRRSTSATSASRGTSPTFGSASVRRARSLRRPRCRPSGSANRSPGVAPEAMARSTA